MADDASIGSDDQRLRNRVPAVHQRHRRFAIGPAQAETKIEVARKSLDAIGRRVRIFSRQTNELYAAPGELFAHLLVFRNFPAARAAPRGPEINHHDLAAEVREAEGARYALPSRPCQSSSGFHSDRVLCQVQRSWRRSLSRKAVYRDARPQAGRGKRLGGHSRLVLPKCARVLSA